MCGIWGLVSKVGLTAEQLGKLFNAFMQVKNRGPDFSSFNQISDNVLVGFHRLAIMDLTPDGNQPFCYTRPDGSYVYCVCNGEIYDYKKLKDEYNITTKSNSDCEIIIPLYEKVGVDKLVRLLGSEYAFMIIDVNKEGKVKMIVGRDPIGVRPCFWAEDDNSICISSELKGLTDIYEKCYVFPPGHYMVYENGKMEFTEYYKYEYKEISPVPNIEVIYAEIRKRLINCVRKRLMCDRSLGCLLSGGLDSSLVVGIINHLINNESEFAHLKERKIPLFTIGFKSGSTDVPFAKQVARYVGDNFEHHIIEIDEGEALDAIDETIYSCETIDITSLRASTVQRIIAKYIRENTDIKVLIQADGSDENWQGYRYFHNAPDIYEGRKEAIRLVKDIHKYDGLRSDRCMAHHGLEVRLPFCDPEIVDYAFSLPPNLTEPIDGLEKYTLRQAFLEMQLIPKNCCLRPKEALSDGCSGVKKSWYQIIQEHVEQLVTDDEFQNNKDKFKHCPPFTKESYYYRKKFVEYFDNSEQISRVIPYFWMPKWCSETNDPSARTLKNYKE